MQRGEKRREREKMRNREREKERIKIKKYVFNVRKIFQLLRSNKVAVLKSNQNI